MPISIAHIGYFAVYLPAVTYTLSPMWIEVDSAHDRRKRR